jgi:hypothetical protein
MDRLPAIPRLFAASITHGCVALAIGFIVFAGISRRQSASRNGGIGHDVINARLGSKLAGVSRVMSFLSSSSR